MSLDRISESYTVRGLTYVRFFVKDGKLPCVRGFIPIPGAPAWGGPTLAGARHQE